MRLLQISRLLPFYYPQFDHDSKEKTIQQLILEVDTIKRGENMYEFFQNFQKSTKAKEHPGLVEKINNLIKLLIKNDVESED